MDLSHFIGQLSRRELPLAFPGHWVGNKWAKYPNAKPTAPSINPNGGETLIVCNSDKQILLDALTQADAVATRLADQSIDQKIETIRRMRQALTDYRQALIEGMQVECGKPYWEAETDFDASIKFFDNAISKGPRLTEALLGPSTLDVNTGHYTSTPIGTVVAYLPFSTPMISFAKYFTAATVAGCPIIVCPSLHASICGVLFGAVSQTIELPAGSLSVVFGTFENFQSVISDKRIQAIIYTGSREHCELIRRESRSVPGRQLVLQSGGKNSVLVHSSASIETAVQAVVWGAFESAGQLCASTSRVFVHKSVIKPFIDALVDKSIALKVGRTDEKNKDGHNDPFMGPLYSKKAVDKFLRYQTMAHREAQKDLLWGKAVETKEATCLVTPGIHLMKNFDRNNAYQSNVLFCPDVAIYEYEVLDHAIDMINATDAPYCVSFIGDEDILKPRIHRFLAPNLLLNLPTVAVEHHPALAGKLQSGHHRFNGMGLCMLLSYPQLMHTAEGHMDLLKHWPF